MASYLDDDAQLVRSALDPGVTPPPKSDYLFILYAVLMRAKGASVELADVHDAWAAWTILNDADHRSLVPFEALDLATRTEDEPYLRAIQKAAMYAK